MRPGLGWRPKWRKGRFQLRPVLTILHACQKDEKETEVVGEYICLLIFNRTKPPNSERKAMLSYTLEKNLRHYTQARLQTLVDWKNNGIP